MTDSDILCHVDHTLLKPTATWEEIKKCCEEAIEYHTASVCIPPSFVVPVHETYGEKLVICTVLGFPLGYDTKETKISSAADAVSKGAAELDMVVNIGDVKSHSYDKITIEISAMKKAVGDHILKVIIETCYLTDEEKIRLCGCVTAGGADFIKTSTGFGDSGATLQDVLLLREHIGPTVRIKAAGGIRSREDMVAFLEAGADRLGTSSAVKILAGGAAGAY